MPKWIVGDKYCREDWKVLRQEGVTEGGVMAVREAVGGVSQPDAAVEGEEECFAKQDCRGGKLMLVTWDLTRSE